MSDATAPAPPDIGNPALHAARVLTGDLASTLVFAGLNAAFHSLRLAVVAGIGVGVAQMGWHLARRRRPDALQVVALLLVVVFGTATLVTQDARFVMLKPTLIYLMVAAVMCRRGWMNRYAPPVALRWAADITTVFGFVWAALFAATAGLNLGLALWAGPAVWGAFIASFPLASKLVLTATQYGVTRTLVIRRMRAAGVLPAVDA